MMLMTTISQSLDEDNVNEDNEEDGWREVKVHFDDDRVYVLDLNVYNINY